MKTRIVAIVIGLSLAYWGISLGRSLSENEESRVKVEKLPASDFGTQAPRAVEGEAPKDETRGPAAAVTPEAPPAKFEYQAELDSYLMLKALIFPNDEQKNERKQIVNNSRLIKAIGERLVKQPLLKAEDQDIAVDILLEALKDGDVQSAQAALLGIVADAQVENSGLAQSVREQLAGIKAEVLFHWVAAVPAESARLATVLPGPVSQRIWQNVQNAHQSNLAQSQSEVN